MSSKYPTYFEFIHGFLPSRHQRILAERSERFTSVFINKLTGVLLRSKAFGIPPTNSVFFSTFLFFLNSVNQSMLYFPKCVTFLLFLIKGNANSIFRCQGCTISHLKAYRVFHEFWLKTIVFPNVAQRKFAFSTDFSCRWVFFPIHLGL